MNFGTFLGNAALRERLNATQGQGKLSHCYLLCGPEGSGKHTLATLLAAAMQCPSADAPCGQCLACRKVLAGSHPDVTTCIDGKHKQFGVDAARALCADAYLRPNEGRRKVYLLPQELNLSAQNALLKLIEEPPPYAVFLILTPNADRLLPTVRSRSQELRLAPLDRPTLLRALRERCPGRTDGDYDAAIAVSGGYLGQALDALEHSGLSGRTAQFAAACADGAPLALLELLVGMERLGREEFCAELGQWQRLLHQAMRARSGLPAGAEAQAIAARHDGTRLLAAAAAIAQAADDAQSNAGIGHLCGALRTALSTIFSLS